MRFALTCPICEHVSVPARDLELFLGRGSAEAELAFECPICDAVVRTRCDRPTARLLAVSGVRVHRPLEGTLPHHPVAPSQSEATASARDEVAAFGRLLATDGWFDRLLAEPPGPVEVA